MSIGNDVIHATSKIKMKQERVDILVNVDKLDNIVSENGSVPNVIKIDVEGFELQVLKGMEYTLSNPSVRVIAIEIHFSLLEKEGQVNAPTEIRKILESNQFKIKWIDYSHIIALREY